MEKVLRLGWSKTGGSEVGAHSTERQRRTQGWRHHHGLCLERGLLRSSGANCSSLPSTGEGEADVFLFLADPRKHCSAQVVCLGLVYVAQWDPAWLGHAGGALVQSASGAGAGLEAGRNIYLGRYLFLLACVS